MKNKTINVTAEVKKLFTDGGKAKAMVSINIEGFVVRGVRLVDGAHGMFLSMPSRKTEDNEYKAICFPVTNELRIKILNAAKAAYEKAVAAQAAADKIENEETDDESDNNEE